MEYQNKTLQNISKKQQVAVISKLQNMQWLKNNVSLPGYVKSRHIKKGVDNLRDLEAVKFAHTSINNNIESPNSVNTIFITHDNKCDFEIETDVTERSVVSTNAVSTCNLKNKIENSSSLLNEQELDLKRLEGQELIKMTNTDSLIIQNLKIECKLEEQEKGNCSTLNIATKDTSQNAVVCNLIPLKIQDNINKTNPTNFDDKNNNDKLNCTKKLNSKSGIAITTVLKKDNDQEKDSNNISSNREKNPDPFTKSLNLTKTFNFASKFKKIYEHQNSAFDNKHKNEMKDSFKHETAVVIKKHQDKKDHQSNQSILNISKELKSTCNSQSKKESEMKYSSESTSRCASKNVKENEQNKTTSDNVNKQSKVNRVNSSYRKTENKSMSKTYNDSSETTYSVIKEKKYNSNSFHSIPLKTTVQTCNVQEECFVPNNKLITSDNKSGNTKPHITIQTEQVAKTSTLKDECINKCIDDKLVTNITNQETNTSSKKIEKIDGNITQNFSYKNFVNECTEQKETFTNPPLQDMPNLQTNTQNIKESTHNDFCDNNPQFDNMYSTNVWYDYKNLQQNIYQQQTPSNPNFIHPIPDQFIRSCPVNTTLPSLIPNVSHSDVNAVHLNQYGNVPTMQNNSMNANSMSNSNLPTNTKNVNMMQYQMPNMVLYNNSNVKPQPNFGAHPMTNPDEQYNMHGYGMNYLYCINNCPVCRNNNYLLLQNWNVPNIYPVPLSIVTNSNQCNCNLCCNTNHMIYKNPGVVTQTPVYVRAEEVPREQNLQGNFMKSMSKAWYNDKSLKSNEAYNTNLQPQEFTINMQEQVDPGQTNQDGEFLNNKETNNLPIISPKDYMNYESNFLANNKATRPQTKYNEIKESTQFYNSQNKKSNRRSFLSREYVPNAKIDCGKKIFKQYNSSYRAQ